MGAPGARPKRRTGEGDLDAHAREIERGGAEVVGLQEVDRHWGERSAFDDQARRLAKRLRMHDIYGTNLDLDPPEAGLPLRQYGTAVLSEHPIRESRNTLLPRPHGGEQRGLLEAVIDVRGVRMRFATTHLQHDNAEERLAQSQRIAELLALAPEPTVLVGDLNARPDDPELAPLWPVFLDAWELAGEGPGNTYPAEAPASPASDHLQLTAEIEVANPRATWTRGFDVQAHRGGLGLTTESTLPAFAKALETGVTTRELDVQITEDGWAVVTHDRQVSANKCRDTAPAFPGDPEFPYVRDNVGDLTLAQVKTLV